MPAGVASRHGRIEIERACQLGRGDGQVLLGLHLLCVQQEGLRARTVRIADASLAGLGEGSRGPHDLHQAFLGFADRVQLSLGADERQVAARDVEQTAVLDGPRRCRSARDDLRCDEGSKIGVAQVSEDVHGRDGHGLRADCPVAAAKVDRLLLDFEDLAVGFLQRPLVKVIHRAGVQRGEQHAASLQLQRQALLNGLATSAMVGFWTWASCSTVERSTGYSCPVTGTTSRIVSPSSGLVTAGVLPFAPGPDFSAGE